MLERELTDLNLYAPVSGLLKPLEKVEDPIFSQKIVGEGIAIVPFERKLYAPCDGYVTYIHEAKHAMFIRTMQNIDVLLHVGIDTVELKGKGFDVHVCEKEKIKCGQLLWEVDFDLLKSRGKVIDIASTHLTVEMTGDHDKIHAFIDMMKVYGIKEIARTGITALGRWSD